MKRLLLAGLLALTLVPTTGFAVPLLQLYVEGASYDTDTETWVTTASNFRLWVIGDVEGTKISLGGGNFTYPGIADVRLSVAHLTSETGMVSFTPTTTSLPPYGDPSAPGAPTLQSTGVGDQPIMSDGNPLPSHGIYGPGTSWEAYRIGDFLAMESPVGDFINTYPTTFPHLGQVNVYDVAVTGYTQVHFDAYNHVVGFTDAKFAPFSHDAGGNPVPEPGTLILLGAGLVSAAGARLARGRKRS